MKDFPTKGTIWRLNKDIWRFKAGTLMEIMVVPDRVQVWARAVGSKDIANLVRVEDLKKLSALEQLACCAPEEADEG